MILNRIKKMSGFSLLELIFVITLIVILSGLTMKMGSYVYQKIEMKRAYRDLANIQLAIEAFYQEYGHYPPASHFGHQPQDLLPNSSNDVSDGDAAPAYIVPVGERRGAGPGLEGFIIPPSKLGDRRNSGASFEAGNLNPKAEKWAKYLKDLQIGDYSLGTQTTNIPGVGDVHYEQYGIVIADPWMDTGVSPRYIYSSPGPDYQTYVLGCAGPNTNSAADDFYVTSGSSGKHTYEQK